MSNYEATKYDFDGGNLTGIEGIPTATVVPWTSGSVPSGFLECNGAAVSRSTYSALYAIVGTTYGSGDGVNTFNLPDLQDEVVVGKSNNKAIGSTGGANTVASTGNIGGSTANATLSAAQLANHQHDFEIGLGPGSGTGARKQTGVADTAFTGEVGSGQGHSHNLSATFSGDATSVLQPYLTLIYIIKT